MKKSQTIMTGCLFAVAAVACANNPPLTYRLYDGITQYIVNPTGCDFTITLDVRDINFLNSGPRELLVKVYDPDGRLAVREIIPDDGIASRAYVPRIGGWDHEMWYYVENYSRGSQPMVRWSAFSDPARLEAIAKRTFTYAIKSGKKGVYRVLIVGTPDHYLTLQIDRQLRTAVAGTALWLHGHGDMFRKSYIYVPRGTIGLHLGFAEYDPPQTRRFTLTTPDGKRWYDGPATGGFWQGEMKFDKPGQYDDQLLTLEVSEGAGDFMLHLLLNNAALQNGRAGSFAVLAPDEATAKAVQAGAIYHNDKVFWHPFQVRLHDWLNSLKPEDFVPKDDQGNEIQVLEVNAGAAGDQGPRLSNFPLRPGFVAMNGAHNRPPLCDRIMHDYPAWKNRPALNLAIRDLAELLNLITTGDSVAVPGWNANLAYIFAPFGWHAWRPALRIARAEETPAAVKAILKEAFILCGDRLGFATGIERGNGNAFALIPAALRWCYEITDDELQKNRFEVYLDRFATEGWGEGTGISPSGDIQEHFAHDHHYGSYIMFAGWNSVLDEFKDARFQKLLNRQRELYSYTWNPDTSANPWSSRTAHSINAGAFASLGFTWKGEPGPDFTVSVNGGNEWFAARRKSYYVLTFHGRLAPMWLNNYFASRLGYGGGAICQLTVPGKGTVLASTLNGAYGEGMQPRNWRNFHIHSLVGEMADGLPLVAADSEHDQTARLDGDTVSSSGEVRDCPVRVTRRYTFHREHIVCAVQLADTGYRQMLWGMGRKSDVKEAYEMIPFVAGDKDVNGQPAPNAVATKITVEGLGELTAQPQEAKTIIIDRGGYGVRIELERPMKVHRSPNSAVMVQLTDQPTPASQIALSYRLIPFGAN